MHKYELKEKWEQLVWLRDAVWQASDRTHPNTLKCELSEEDTKSLQKASKDIEKACDLIENVLYNIEIIR